MAASSGDGIPAQLAALLGHPVKRIRITDETPPRISVIDVATAITGKHVRNAARDVLFVQAKHPDVSQKLSHFPSSARELGVILNLNHVEDGGCKW